MVGDGSAKAHRAQLILPSLLGHILNFMTTLLRWVQQRELPKGLLG